SRPSTRARGAASSLPLLIGSENGRQVAGGPMKRREFITLLGGAAGALNTHNTQLRGRNRHARPEQNYSPSRAANSRRGRRIRRGRRTRRASASTAADAATHR